MSWMADEQPFAAKLEGADCFANVDIVICDLEPSETEMAMPYMNNVQYQKPIQPKLLSESRRKKRTKKSAGNASASGKSVILLTDSSMGQPNVSKDDDDFVDPPPRRQDIPPMKNLQLMKYCQLPLILQMNHTLTCRNGLMELADIKLQMSCFNDVHSTKMNSIIQMQGVLKTDLMEIRTNMQFLSETVSAMISSSMEEIMRRFSEKAKDRGIEIHGVGDRGTHVTRGSDKTDEVQTVQPNVDRKGKGKIDPSEDIGTPYSLQPPSFDLGIGYMQLDDIHSENVQKQVDSIISDVLTATKSVQVERFTSPDGRSELPVKRVLRLARILQSSFVVGEGKTYRDWKVLEGIEPYVKILPALMNALGISKKDPDYDRPGSKELKVYIDSTLPQ
ncbi:Hypothetical predicted protein [Olea europaea subsp. europaea]|uniref:Uncharacterized protein n=1 Tax=Olea europaea subsp. europaea TaxID=158383 RepID=A0A8S0TCS2_OLEEU|nr:Hypothetical predicted protein [Olea europaea subsp. europaea]